MYFVALTSFSRGVLMQRTRPLLLPSNCSGDPAVPPPWSWPLPGGTPRGTRSDMSAEAIEARRTRIFTGGPTQREKFETRHEELNRPILATAFYFTILTDTNYPQLNNKFSKLQKGSVSACPGLKAMHPCSHCLPTSNSMVDSIFSKRNMETENNNSYLVHELHVVWAGEQHRNASLFRVQNL